MDIKLVDAIAGVRDELLEAAVRGVGRNPAFLVGPIEMEFEVELRADAKAKAGFRVWTVGADVEAGVSRGRTHRVKFTLTPQNERGGDWLVHGSGERADGPGQLEEEIRD